MDGDPDIDEPRVFGIERETKETFDPWKMLAHGPRFWPKVIPSRVPDLRASSTSLSTCHRELYNTLQVPVGCATS
jgi:hypothetical protein